MTHSVLLTLWTLPKLCHCEALCHHTCSRAWLKPPTPPARKLPCSIGPFKTTANLRLLTFLSNTVIEKRCNSLEFDLQGKRSWSCKVCCVTLKPYMTLRQEGTDPANLPVYPLCHCPFAFQTIGLCTDWSSVLLAATQLHSPVPPAMPCLSGLTPRLTTQDRG